MFSLIMVLTFSYGLDMENSCKISNTYRIYLDPIYIVMLSNFRWLLFTVISA